MGLFDTIRRAVGSDDAADSGGQLADDASAAGSPDDGPDVLDTRELDPAAFREHAETVVENAPPLDFSTDALARLDAAIAENYDGRTAGPEAGAAAYTENTVRFGSYLGEVLVRSYDAEWVDRDGRWGVVVSGAADDVTVPVFDVAVRSFGDEPVFAALVERLESTLDLDASGSGDERDGTSEPEPTEERGPTAESDVADESDVAAAVTKPTRLVDQEPDGPASESEPAVADSDAPGADDGVNETDDGGPDYPSETEPTRAGGADEADAPATDSHPEAPGSTDGSADEERPTDRQSPDSPTGSETVGDGIDASEPEAETASESEPETAPEPEAETASDSDRESDLAPEGTESETDAASSVPPDATDDAPSTDAAAPTGAAADRSWDGVRAEHAETAVDFADFWGERDLDFTPASLSRLDDLVAEEWDDERFAETTFGSEDSFDDRAFTSVVTELGSYFGEVLVRHLDGEWTADTDHDAAVVVGGTDARFAVPVSDVAITSLRERPVFGRSYDALLSDLGRDGPTR
ncbi:ICP22 family protein [Haloarcula salina]|uniref:Uncharacterized protein n=1 Tax=Haloarcula salina TaxID=1429914 RepID=A0AA41G2G8_9EURY|nr:hypothetical protein [Haloarcula salina]MBV0902374.1 hypothetical protein [Haloarcula salina]